MLLRCAVALSLLAGALCARADEAAPQRCKYVHVATVPVRYAGPNLGITMAGRINGTPATLLVDTGAQPVALTPTGTERRGLALRDIGRRVEGVGGDARLYSARVDDFAAGPVSAGAGYMRVIGDFASPPAFDAIAGASFLLQADLEFSLATKELRFFRPNNCKDSFLAYWDPAAIEIPFAKDWLPNRPPEFIVQLNGRKLRAIIDSGADTTVVTLAAAKRAGLKLDAPGVQPTGHIGGIGEDRVASWSTSFETLQLGDEIIRNAQVGVIDANHLDVDLLLGADFLRAHRVLFAMSQSKLYFSYTGGEPLGQRKGLEDWMLQEANKGNSDAQLVLAGLYQRGDGVAQDAQQAGAWLQKAVDNGNPRANFMHARFLGERGEYVQAARRLRVGLDNLPGERYAALSLYTVRLRTGNLEVGRRELEASIARAGQDVWPIPIARYYLGKLSEEQLLAAAAAETRLAAARSCLARSYIAEHHAALGDAGKAAAVLAQQQGCAAPVQ
jgi:predicted aspartyl protease